jgi:hypothetical protein
VSDIVESVNQIAIFLLARSIRFECRPRAVRVKRRRKKATSLAHSENSNRKFEFPPHERKFLDNVCSFSTAELLNGPFPTWKFMFGLPTLEAFLSPISAPFEFN